MASRWRLGHLNGVGDRTLPFSRPLSLRGENAGGRRHLSTGDGPLCLYCLRSEGHRGIGSAVGTYSFALILRVRRLSARIPGPASSVEACHPQMHFYYTTSLVPGYTQFGEERTIDRGP